MNIEILSGSPRKNSVTHRLALFLQKEISKNTLHKVNIVDVRDWEFPLLQQEVFSNPSKAPAILQPLATRMFQANAFIIVTPEYNGSYTSALKNLFDHFPKQARKIFGIATASTGTLGGMRASQQLQLLINALFGIGSPYMLITPLIDKKFDAEGNLTDLLFKTNVDLFLSEFLWLAESLHFQSETIE